MDIFFEFVPEEYVGHDYPSITIHMKKSQTKLALQIATVIDGAVNMLTDENLRHAYLPT